MPLIDTIYNSMVSVLPLTRHSKRCQFSKRFPLRLFSCLSPSQFLLHMWRGESSSLDVPRSTDLQCVGDGFGGG